MKPSESKHEFQARLERQLRELSSLSVIDGINAMFEFYRDVRATDCDIEGDGDMLLFQWGIYDFGHGEHFLVDVTRQFIDSRLEDDDAISQLHLSFLHTPEASLVAIEAGDRWCTSPTELPGFEVFVRSHSALLRTRLLAPKRVTLEYDEV